MGDVPSIIPDLETIRNHRGLSLREIADVTKIRVFYLQAIESGKFQKLPGGLYTRSYVRQYAHAIDFDEAAILRALPPEPEQEEHLPPSSRRRALLGRLFPFLGAFTGEAGEPGRSGYDRQPADGTLAQKSGSSTGRAGPWHSD